MRNDDTEGARQRVADRRRRRRRASSRRFASSAAPRSLNGTVGIRYLAARRVRPRGRAGRARGSTLVRSEMSASSISAVVARVASSAALSSLDREHRRDDGEAEHEAGMPRRDRDRRRAHVGLGRRHRRPARARRRAAPARARTRTAPAPPTTAVAVGEERERDETAGHRDAARDRGESCRAAAGPSLRTRIAPSGRPLTTSAPVIGAQPHTIDEQQHREEQRADERAVQQQEPRCSRDQVRRPVLGAARSRRPAPAVDHRDERDRGQRRLQQEDAAPAEQLREEAAERGPERGADGARQRPTSRSRARRSRGCRRAPERCRPARARRRSPARTRPTISSSNELAKPQTSDAAENSRSPMPANTWPRTRRSSGSTASAPTTIAMLYAVIVHDTPTIDTSKVP